MDISEDFEKYWKGLVQFDKHMGMDLKVHAPGDLTYTLEIKKQFVVNEKNQKIAVQIDIDTFKKIEDLLENHILAQIMKESSEDKSYNVENARAYYQQLLEKNPVAGRLG